MTTLIISNEEMDDIMKIVKSLDEYVLLIKGVSEIIKNEAKEQRGGFLASYQVPKNITGRRVMRAGEGQNF